MLSLGLNSALTPERISQAIATNREALAWLCRHRTPGPQCGK